MTIRFNHLRVALLAVAAAGLLAAVGLVVLYAQPAQANYPGIDGKIAYSWPDANNRLQIHTIHHNGGDSVKVTHNQLGQPPDAGDERPAISPNGNRIAYQGWDGNDFEIYTDDLAGGNRFQVTHNDVRDENPYYSPDGKRIAYSGLTRTDWEIFTIDARGGRRFNVTNDDAYDYYPDYSPNGKKIAYAAKDTRAQDTEIRTIKATGGRPFTLTNNAMDDLAPSYSPDGKRIAYMHYSDPDRPERAAAIYKIAAGGGKGLLVTANGGTGALFPSWGSVP